MIDGPFVSADRKRQIGRRRRTLLALPGLVVALPLLAGCSVPSASTQGSSSERGGEQFPAQPPVALPGVESCSTLRRLTPTDTAATSNRLSSRTLSCLSDGPALDVSTLGSKPVVINLWASWCGPCRDEMPILESTATTYGTKVAFVGVDTKDSSDNAAAFLQKVGVTYPQLSDPGAGLLGDVRSPGLPVTVILNADGTVFTKRIGPFNNQQELSDLLDQALSR